MVLFVVGGCEDLRHFSGEWQGPVSPDAAQRQGFAAGDRARVTVRSVTRQDIDLAVTVPGVADPVAFEPVRGASADALGEMRLPGEPLRSFVGWLRPAGQMPLFAVLSLFAEERIELRLLRGPDEIYGVFRLTRP